MRDLLDEIMDVETNIPTISPTLQKKSCDANCQCQKCRGKRHSMLRHSPKKGCGCKRCQQNEMSNLEEESETWLDSIMGWGTNLVNSLSGNIQYSVTPGEEFGRKWKNMPVPGLPSWVRKTSANGAALPHVETQARATGLGETFVKTMIHMARTESQGRFALPANNFNNNPRNLRPSGKSLITAWGVFQFNRDAWTCLFPESERRTRRAYVPKGTAGCSGCKNLGGCAYPWDCSAVEEIAIPMKRYVELFQEVKQAGGSNEDAAAGLRLWHVSPVNWYRRWLENARRQGFENAWNLLPSEARLRTGNFLDGAGVARPYSGEFDYEDNENLLIDELLFELSSSNIEKAVDFNRKNASLLGWDAHRHAIVEKVFKLNYTPDERAFAKAVADWQSNNGLKADGWLGPKTWNKMKPILGIHPVSPPSSVPVGGKMNPASCVFPDGSRSTRSVIGGKVFSEYLKSRSGGIHKGIDVSISSSSTGKFDSKRGTPVYAFLKPNIEIAILKSACATSSNSYFRGLPINGSGLARLEYATVHIPQTTKCGKESKGGYGCTGNSAYGGAVGLVCVYSYLKSDGTTGNFTLYVEYLHLILPNYLPYYKSSGKSYKMTRQEWLQHPNAKNIGVGPLMIHRNRLSSPQLTSGKVLVGYFGSTTWPHVHIQAAYSPKIQSYVRDTRFDPLLMIN